MLAIALGHGAKPLGRRVKGGGEAPLRPVFGEHALLYDKLLWRKLENDFIVTRIAKTLEDIAPLRVSPIQGEFEMRQ